MDYLNVRLSPVCPLCLGKKEQGLIACWPCYRKHDLRSCPPAIEAKLAGYEADLVANRRAMSEAMNREAFAYWLNQIDARHGYDCRRHWGTVDQWQDLYEAGKTTAEAAEIQRWKNIPRAI